MAEHLSQLTCPEIRESGATESSPRPYRLLPWFVIVIAILFAGSALGLHWALAGLNELSAVLLGIANSIVTTGMFYYAMRGVQSATSTATKADERSEKTSATMGEIAEHLRVLASEVRRAEANQVLLQEGLQCRILFDAAEEQYRECRLLIEVIAGNALERLRRLALDELDAHHSFSISQAREETRIMAAFRMLDSNSLESRRYHLERNWMEALRKRLADARIRQLGGTVLPHPDWMSESLRALSSNAIEYLYNLSMFEERARVLRDKFRSPDEELFKIIRRRGFQLYLSQVRSDLDTNIHNDLAPAYALVTSLGLILPRQ